MGNANELCPMLLIAYIAKGWKRLIGAETKSNSPLGIKKLGTFGNHGSQEAENQIPGRHSDDVRLLTELKKEKI